MRHGSLFSGMGGFDLAAEWMGWENKFHCEWNPFGQRILKHYWPNAKSYEDITKTDFSIWRGRIDILTGGFPCQPYSIAGNREGNEDERHLWPEMLRAIREIAPDWVVGENVRGLINWSNGLVFHQVQTDLEKEGYKVLPFLLPAAGVNAPHERYRIWFVAYSESIGRRTRYRKETHNCRWKAKKYFAQRKGLQHRYPSTCGTRRAPERMVQKRIITYSGNTGSQRRKHQKFRRTRWGEKRRAIAELHTLQDWANFPTQSPVCTRNDGLSSKLDGITFSKWRKESIKAGGNAIVPQLALQIFKAIKLFNEI